MALSQDYGGYCSENEYLLDAQSSYYGEKGKFKINQQQPKKKTKKTQKTPYQFICTSLRSCKAQQGLTSLGLCCSLQAPMAIHQV